MMESKNDASTEPQDIETLRERFNDLNQRKVDANTALALAQQELGNAQRQARETYGTDDINELKKKLEDWTKENEELRRSYQASLDSIESDLERIEQEEQGEE